MSGNKKGNKKSRSIQKKHNAEVKKSETIKTVKDTNADLSRDDRACKAVNADQVVDTTKASPNPPLSKRQKKNRKLLTVGAVNEKLANTQISDDCDTVNTSQQSNSEDGTDEIQNTRENHVDVQGDEESECDNWEQSSGTEKIEKAYAQALYKSERGGWGESSDTGRVEVPVAQGAVDSEYKISSWDDTKKWNNRTPSNDNRNSNPYSKQCEGRFDNRKSNDYRKNYPQSSKSEGSDQQRSTSFGLDGRKEGVNHSYKTLDKSERGGWGEFSHTEGVEVPVAQGAVGSEYEISSWDSPKKSDHRTTSNDNRNSNPYSRQSEGKFENRKSNDYRKSYPQSSKSERSDQQRRTSFGPDGRQEGVNHSYKRDESNRNFERNNRNEYGGNSYQNSDRPKRNSDARYSQQRGEDWGSNEMSRGSDGECEEKDRKEFFTMLGRREFRDYRFVKVREIEADLFSMGEEYSFAHCVAEDMSMGSGIAVNFSQQFKSRADLLSQRQKQGGLAVLKDKGRYVYYLVTKRLSNGKPTMCTLWSSLQKLRGHVEQYDVKKLAIPRIGCGLDRLEWSEVKAMLEYIFKNTDIEITVCNFQQPPDGDTTGTNRTPPSKPYFKCMVRNVEYPLVEIEPGTAIIYFGTVDGFVSEEMESLNTKFRIIADYKRSDKKLGDIIHEYKNNKDYSLFGCIVRKSEKDSFDFLSFQKCIDQLKKINKLHYGYVGIQAFLDDDDDLLVNKIINLLKHSLIAKLEVYVCWSGKMLKFMPSDYSY